MRRRPHTHGGFTLVELLVVMSILALLLSLAAPKYFDSVDRAKEAALRTDLRVIREAIDKHRADTGRLPDSIDRLVQARYLRSVPVDPITDREDSWVVVLSTDPLVPGVQDIKSGASGTARDGSTFASW
jgi:general secretion pathway protein G